MKEKLFRFPLLGLKLPQHGGILDVLRIHVDKIPFHVEIPAQDHSLVQALHKITQGCVSGRSIGEPGKTALRVRDIDTHDIEAVVFQSNQAALLVKLPAPMPYRPESGSLRESIRVLKQPGRLAEFQN